MRNKKDIIYETLEKEQIDICALQEVEIPITYQQNLLSSKNYKIEIEQSNSKARNATVVKNNIDYIRRSDLECEDCSIVILDINTLPKLRLINIYRSFNPPNNKSPIEAFKQQISIIKNSLTHCDNREIIIIGDFNIDYKSKNLQTYRLKNYFDVLDEAFDPLNLIQMVKFPTWQRVINNNKKNSTLDHLYVKNPTKIKNLCFQKPIIGDHCLITFEIDCNKEQSIPEYKRCWRNYSKDKLCNELSRVEFRMDSDDPQSLWNSFENELLTIVDELVPYVPFSNNQSLKSLKTPIPIKNKLNLRKRLLKSLDKRPSNILRDRIKNLNCEIKNHYRNQKFNSIQRSIIPGNSKSLWTAVKIANNQNINKIPKIMFKNGMKLNPENTPSAFALHFKNKVDTIVTESVIDPDVYNGTRKLNAPNENFMQLPDILKAVQSMKTKNCEGHDRLPQRILIDGISILQTPLAVLFNKIYTSKNIPQQWKISKVTPIFKKGAPNDIENYRPISNLCSTSKIFEKLILHRLQKLECINKIDLTGKSQHGFKHKHSTATASLTIQSLLARAIDGDNFALMASLDLSSAFDVVNIELLLERLLIIGIPDDVIELISNWLRDRFFYVTIGEGSSDVYDSNVGTVQGSILGPILYAIFVSPLFDLEKMTLFADDNYIILWNKQLSALITDMKKTIESITKWLRQSGLKVNELKTELCLFHRKDQPPVQITVNDSTIISKDHIKVLGIIFDSKLQWHYQIQNTVNKSKRALNAISLIRKYFSKSQLLTIVTSIYYSSLYYNAEIWLLPTLKPQLKQKLLSASAAPLKFTTFNYDNMTSFDVLHYINQRATPKQITIYKHALLLHKTYNDTNLNNDWLSLFFNQQFNQREPCVKFFNNSNYKVGNNLLANRFTCLNGKIELNWLNLPYETFKIKCKKEFL